MFITTTQLHSTKPELRFSAASNPARSVSEICNGEDLWQFVPTGNKVKRLRRSTIHQKQFIISARCFFTIKSVKNDMVPSNKTKKLERLVCNYLIVFLSRNIFFFLGLIFLFLYFYFFGISNWIYINVFWRFRVWLFLKFLQYLNRY